ncbi:MAG TPA: SIMPL domain-containing protein [Cellvibrionaceae bacterium]
MTELRNSTALLLGVCLITGLTLLGYLLGQAAIDVKEYERTVTVKGLAEREVPADIVIWPIRYTLANNELNALYAELDKSKALVYTFLQQQGIASEDISIGAPVTEDKSTYAYGGQAPEFRYVATQVVTVYSENIEAVRAAMTQLSELGKQGLVLSGDNYNAQTQYLYRGLNDSKPAMIEQATKNAREVAVKFAEDSGSKLGKIKQASQGQFSISERDANNPHIKNIRVVSTVEYYLSD